MEEALDQCRCISESAFVTQAGYIQSMAVIVLAFLCVANLRAEGRVTSCQSER